ncbi:diguanylate cyclase [Aquisalimonas sp.]|uniref:GGDEF domain-containing protein n=1 Tax=Aquisalimonas sp. TaxID=1872621 RepID=UPI0025C3B33C|nr:diguanylate cyclase [Aquisalimonas sp.]
MTKGDIGTGHAPRHLPAEEHPALFEAAVRCSYNPVIITSADLAPPGPEILYVNPAFEAMTHYTASEVIGRSPRLLQGPESCRETLAALRRTLEAGERFEGTVVNYRRDGSPYHVEWSVSPIRDSSGAVTHFVSLQRDISDRLAAEEELKRLAITDRLTGLNNRLHFEEILEQELERHQCHGTVFSLALFDIDDFKAINDRYGHQTGDEVLRSLAGLLQNSTRAGDHLGRWGGEEFTLLLTGTGPTGAVETAEQLRRLVAEWQPGQLPPVTVSFGITGAASGDTIKKMLRRADLALYRAKERGKNRVEIQLRDSPS